MGEKLTAQFETRRDAEMAVERLVQEHEVERGSILISPVGENNSAGEEPGGSDARSGEPSTEARTDPKLEGLIEVSVDLQDDTKVDAIRGAFTEFQGRE